MLALFELLSPFSFFTSQFKTFYPMKHEGIFFSCKTGISLQISEKYNVYNPQCEIYTFPIHLMVFAKIHHDLCVVAHITVSHRVFQDSYMMVSHAILPS